MQLSREGAAPTPWRIAVDGLNFSYAGTSVFDGFAFQSSARVSLIRGPSGCGKTTLLKLLNGLLPVANAREWMVPQPSFLVLQADTLVPWFSGVNNFERFSSGLWSRVQQGPFFDLLQPFINKRAFEMSYGQRRSIELARAFSSNARLLLLDEPFNFLDPTKRNFFLEYLNGVHGSTPQTRVVMTTHYVEEIGIRDADCFEFRGEMPHISLSTTSGATA